MKHAWVVAMALLVGCGEQAPQAPSSGSSAPVLMAIGVTPHNASALVGDVVQYIAVGFFSDGTQHNLGSASWTSTQPLFASIDPITGVATCHAQGITQIYVTAAGVTGLDNLTVTDTLQPPVITTTSLPDADLGVLYSHQLTSSGGAGTWTVDFGTLVGYTCSPTGLISGVTSDAKEIGKHTITLTITNSAGVDTTPMEFEIVDKSVGTPPGTDPTPPIGTPPLGTDLDGALGGVVDR